MRVFAALMGARWCPRRRCLHNAHYWGFSFHPLVNKYNEDLQHYKGPGFKFDRVLFKGQLMVEAMLVGRARQFHEGQPFYLSDHFGVLAFLDVHAGHTHRGDQSRERRSVLAAQRDEQALAENIFVVSSEKAGQEEAALDRARTVWRERGDALEAAKRAGRERTERAKEWRKLASGSASLSTDAFDAEAAWSSPEAPGDVVIMIYGGLPSATWASLRHLAIGGFRRLGETCYALSVVQMLLRLPSVPAWLCAHARLCDVGAESCAACALWAARLDLVQGARRGGKARDDVTGGPQRVARCVLREAEYAGGRRQMDVAAFAQELLLKLCEVEADAGRVGEWVLGTDSVHVATHVDRVFSFVTELRQRCLGCGRASIIPLSESVLCLPLEGVGMAEVTISELYLRSCESTNNE